MDPDRYSWSAGGFGGGGGCWNTIGYSHIKQCTGFIFSPVVAIPDTDTCPVRVHAIRRSIPRLAPCEVMKCSQRGALPAITVHVANTRPLGYRGYRTMANVPRYKSGQGLSVSHVGGPLSHLRPKGGCSIMRQAGWLEQRRKCTQSETGTRGGAVD
jgi:hypothetical protein